MRRLTFEIDYSFCPEGHDWVFLPSSTMYSDIFYCEKCDCFYRPSVERMTRDRLNSDFSRDRAAELIEYAKFRRWRERLTAKDMARLTANVASEDSDLVATDK